MHVLCGTTGYMCVLQLFREWRFWITLNRRHGTNIQTNSTTHTKQTVFQMQTAQQMQRQIQIVFTYRDDPWNYFGFVAVAVTADFFPFNLMMMSLTKQTEVLPHNRLWLFYETCRRSECFPYMSILGLWMKRLCEERLQWNYQYNTSDTLKLRLLLFFFSLVNLIPLQHSTDNSFFCITCAGDL